ncbi:MAG: flagellar basal body rod protein FlgB [Clostridiales bacterium]|nr:flagellar basal body rod protein FlgB [Clostridiales bacterium]
MLNSTAFNYIDVLDKASDASWTRESLISNNIANVDTPGYKRQDLDFQTTLKTELGRTKYEDLDQRIRNVDLSNLNASAYTDLASYSYRLDGNNVDIDTENVELASEQIRYEALIEGIDEEFSRMRVVLSS